MQQPQGHKPAVLPAAALLAQANPQVVGLCPVLETRKPKPKLSG